MANQSHENNQLTNWAGLRAIEPLGWDQHLWSQDHRQRYRFFVFSPAPPISRAESITDYQVLRLFMP